jgi:hypothetical protein
MRPSAEAFTDMVLHPVPEAEPIQRAMAFVAGKRLLLLSDEGQPWKSSSR